MVAGSRAWSSDVLSQASMRAPFGSFLRVSLDDQVRERILADLSTS
jgi:hypothetical protein